MRQWEGYLEHLTPDRLWEPRENVGKGHCTCFSELLLRFGCRVDYQGLPWCVIFVFAAYWMEFGRDEATRLLGYPTPSSGRLYRRLRRRGRARTADYRPKEFDLVFYSASLDKKPTHVGIVLSADEYGFEALEGNCHDPSGVIPWEHGGAVAVRRVDYYYPRILGYGELGMRSEE